MPVVDVFTPPFVIREYREATYADRLASLRNSEFTIEAGKIIKVIDHAYEAALHMAEFGAANDLENHINAALSDSSEFKALIDQMPAEVPDALNSYRSAHRSSNMDQVDRQIDHAGILMGEGQNLFHGGAWIGANADAYETSRPLSTSFCPQVALRNAAHRGKAYRLGRIDLVVLTVKAPVTKAFVFNPEDEHHQAHEKEVLFASGATLTRLSSERTGFDLTVLSEDGEHRHDVPVYIITANIC
jgi:hypothetical protein